MTTVIDHQFCVDEPLKQFLEGKCVDVPVMAGNTRDEFPGFLPIGEGQSLEEAARSALGSYSEAFLKMPEAVQPDADGGYGRVNGIECTIKGIFGRRKDSGSARDYYYYRFEPDIPGWDQPGCFHSVDLWFFFETLAKCWRPFTGKHYDLARQMCNYWTNFIKTGDPNGVDADGTPMPEWAPYTAEQPAEMVFTTDGARPVRGQERPFVRLISDVIIDRIREDAF